VTAALREFCRVNAAKYGRKAKLAKEMAEKTAPVFEALLKVRGRRP
jgi:hypothetical protein